MRQCFSFIASCLIAYTKAASVAILAPSSGSDVQQTAPLPVNLELDVSGNDDAITWSVCYGIRGLSVTCIPLADGILPPLEGLPLGSQTLDAFLETSSGIRMSDVSTIAFTVVGDSAESEALLVGLVDQEARSLHQEGVESYHSGDLARSQALFASASVLLPTSPTSLEGLGASSFGLGNYSTAASAFLAAMATGSSDDGEDFKNARTARDFDFVQSILGSDASVCGNYNADESSQGEGLVEIEGAAVVSTFFRGRDRYSPARFNEIVAAQTANLRNPAVSALVLVADLAHDCDPRTFLEDPYRKLSVVQQESIGAPTWGELLRVGELYFPNQAVVFAHADIAFFAHNANLGFVPRLLSRSAQKQGLVHARQMAMAITRRPHSACLWASGGGHGLYDIPVDLCTGPHGNAEGVIGFDAYALTMPPPPALQVAADLLRCNRLGADLKMVEAMAAADMVVVDPCVVVMATHIHCTAERTYGFLDDLVTREDILSGRYSRAVRLSGPLLLGTSETLLHGREIYKSYTSNPDVHHDITSSPYLLLSFPSSGEIWVRALLEAAENEVHPTGSVAFDAELWSMGLVGEGRCFKNEVSWVSIATDQIVDAKHKRSASAETPLPPLDGVRRVLSSAACTALLQDLSLQAPKYHDATVVLIRDPFDTVASLWLYRVLSHRLAHLQRRCRYFRNDGEDVEKCKSNDVNLDTVAAVSAAHFNSSDSGWRVFAVDTAQHWVQFYEPLVGDPRIVRLDDLLFAEGIGAGIKDELKDRSTIGRSACGSANSAASTAAAKIYRAAATFSERRPEAAAWGLLSGFATTSAFSEGLIGAVFEVVEPVACAMGFKPPSFPGLACTSRTEPHPVSKNLPYDMSKHISSRSKGSVAQNVEVINHKECLPPNYPSEPSRCVVAFSLYGADERYTGGALANARALHASKGTGVSSRGKSRSSVLSEWRMRVYHDESVPLPVLQALEYLGVECLLVPPQDRGPLGGQLANPRTWRFLVASDPSVARFLIRDVDSRISLREAAAVHAWAKHKLSSSFPFHVMRDHPSHTIYARAGAPIQAGMWGGTRDAVPEMASLLRAAGNSTHYVADQAFLKNYVWPLAVVRGVLQHDSFGCLDATFRTSIAPQPFPWSAKTKDAFDKGFVGAVVLGDGRTRTSDNAARAMAHQPIQCKDRLPS